MTLESQSIPITSIPHADTTSQGVDDHHDQAHTLASHSTEAHAELTGVGVDDHHNESHSHSGQALQTLHVERTTAFTTTTILPSDNTIPQSTEGGELFTLAITPAAGANVLKIDVQLQLSHSAVISNRLTIALFKDSDASAIAVQSSEDQVSGSSEIVVLTHFISAGAASAQTFKIRVGGNQAGTLTVNKVLFGGILASGMQITELAA